MVSRKSGVLVTTVLLVTAVIGYAGSRILFHSAIRSDAAHSIELRANGAVPTAIAVVKGSYVEFDTKDGRSHNIYEGGTHAHSDNSPASSAGPESGIFGPGSGYRVTFSQVGTYEFRDHLHDNIMVSVIVYEPKKK